MRPIEQKVLAKVGDKGLSLDEIEEIVDATPRSELKKSYPDDSHFQSPRYFARQIAQSLVRMHKLREEGGRFMKPKVESKDGDQSKSSDS